MNDPSCPSIRKLATSLLVLAMSGGFASVEAQGLAVRLAPQTSGLRWADDVGLDNDLFYGGGLALGFGQFVSLNGSYRFANAMQTSLGATDYDGGMASENVLDAELFSTGVEIRIGGAMFAPVLTGTGGLLQMSPEGRENVKQVVVGYGGGLDARIRPWLSGQLLVEDLRFRLDRSTLARDEGGGVASDPDRTATRRSTALTLSLGARLGGGRTSARANALDQDMTRVYRGEGLMVRAGLYGGVIRFDDALLLSERPYFGVRGGLDFGPFFGLRGTYAKGAQRDLGGFVGMTTWSGEAQFNVGRVTDWSTHILLGFGQIGFESDFLDTSGATPDDQNAVIVGAGVGIPVGSRAQIVVSLRDHITTVGEISGVSTPNDLRHNFGLSTGLSFLVTGAPSRPGPSGTGPTAIPRDVESVDVPQPGLEPYAAAEPEAGAPAETGADQAARESQVAPDSVDIPLPTPVPSQSGDSARVVTDTGVSIVQDSLSSGRQGNYQSERVVLIPLPTEGEVFIRYGPRPDQAAAGSPTISEPDTVGAPGAAAASASDTATVPDAAGPGLPSGVTTEDLAALEQRLAARLDTLSRGASVDPAQATTPVEPSPELEALRQQVEELAQLMREGALTDRGTLPPADTAAAADTTNPEPRVGVTTEDLAALEQRLAARMDTLARGAPTDTPQPTTAREPSPELEALRQQVEDLAQLMREGTPGGAGTQVIPLVAGPGEELVTELRDPFFQGAELRVGGSSVRETGPGISVAIEALFGDEVLGPLQPFAGLHVSEVGVDGSLAGTAYGGSVSSYGVNTGVRFELPEVRSVEPTLSLGLTGLTGGTRGDSPTEADVVESLYGGFVMGPKIALTGAWRRTPNARLQIVGAVGRLWAGPRGGWTIQAGVRWSRPPQEETFIRRVASSALFAPASSRSEPDTQAPTTGAAAADPERDALFARLDTLEESLRLEREARQRLEASTDSAAAAQAAAEASARTEQARLLAEARADSLATLSDSLAELGRRQAEARAAEEALERGLRELLGVVPSVQSVRRTDGRLVVVLGGSLFPTGATSLGPDTRPAVERVAQIVAGGPVESVVVSGHTDATGAPETNLQISRLRAEAVREVLIEEGVPVTLTEVVAAGELEPIASNDTPEGRRQNRRVEILILTTSIGD
ncbi:MAG: OmpA family protein [Gemmatimonadetes bacterium]|nr:OmpA family protein [Gemmatimonadota bacterium]